MIKRHTLTGSQLRAARVLIDVNAAELAEEALIDLKTLRRAEAMKHAPINMTAANLKAVMTALERRGVTFIDESKTGGPGVRLKITTK